jgi:hypothetical protein
MNKCDNCVCWDQICYLPDLIDDNDIACDFWAGQGGCKQCGYVTVINGLYYRLCGRLPDDVDCAGPYSRDDPRLIKNNNTKQEEDSNE